MRHPHEQTATHTAVATSDGRGSVRAKGSQSPAPDCRLLILGGACSGKTSLARRLAAALQVRPLYLDDEFWFGHWQNTGSGPLVERARKETLSRRWIVDDNYPAVRDAIWQTCTHVVYMEVPLWKALLRGVRRSLDRNRPGVPLKVRQAGGSGETLHGLLPMIWRYHRRKRLRDLAFLARLRGSHVQVVRIRSRTDQQRLIQMLLARQA